MINYQKHILNSQDTIHDALIRLNGFMKDDPLNLFVINEQKQLIGSITDGDIRRGILKGLTLKDEVTKIMFSNFRFLQKNNYTLKQVQTYKSENLKLIPILDEDKKMVRLINLSHQKSLLPLEALLMAGGKGERLRPLTENVPKPMLKVGASPIIEHNIDRLISYGIDTIYISVKYLSEQIIDYFKDGRDKQIYINYIHEEHPLGTIGAANLVENWQTNDVLVMNSDLLTNIDYEDFYLHFITEKADMSVATIPYQVTIPYGVLETKNEKITGLIEKPTYTYYSNAGIYLIKKEMLSFVPAKTFFNATDLIEQLIMSNYKVSHYPILGYWLDIGNLQDFKKAQEDIKHLLF